MSELQGDSDDEIECEDLFVIDSAPSVLKEDLKVPSYDSKFDNVLQEQAENKESVKPAKPKPPRNMCWNCEGNHSLRECQEKRMPDVINRNRSIFMSKHSTPRSGKASRYHLDTEQKFPHNRPGKISSRLRRALGIRPNQLPRHIYRMRSLGYPPGWVEEARVSHSGLFLFNSSGQEVADPGFEEGEIVADGAKDKFDVKKIIEYPGFNSTCDSDIIDETDRLNARPMTEIDSIERMVSIWQPKAVQAYKRKKMKSMDSTPMSSLKVAPDDQKLSSPDDGSINGIDSEEDGEVCDEQPEESEESQSENLDIVKIGKRQSSSPAQCSRSKRPKLDMLKMGSGSNSDSPSRSDSAQKSEGSGNSSSPNSPSILSASFGHIKSVSLGTPVIVRSQYANLPTSEKFSKDICDVINFENLPDSTGKYEKMSGLLKKVRVSVSKMVDDGEECDS